ncbi:MAG: UvrB/UvrC motif-containing protein [Phycisphaeraceae bacterium]|nr:UvrB/UvrC motif-containing protein [Phycisphaeraceae bacterium]QYK49684.1 MAG: UvrB/UvrC motif-containing protein [Phycisphaeraceae bacterium]
MATRNMNKDLTSFLNEWPYEPGHITARLVQGADGEEMLQLRVDLGVLQMKLDGRPDGQRPGGFESLLDLYEDQAAGLSGADDLDVDRREQRKEFGRSAFESGEATEAPRFLGAEECRLLREEAVQYYHRYVGLLAIEDFDRVIRDTTRNLRLLDFCVSHAQMESDRTALEQFRPYVTMIRARALAGRSLRESEPKAALVAIEEGLEALRRIFDEQAPEQFEQSAEVQALRAMRETLGARVPQQTPELPVSQTGELQARLAKAIEDENYELAAILRDEIRQIKD